LAFLHEIFLQFLNYTYDHFTHSYGWSIILLTAVVRLVLLPLTLSGLRGMKAMQQAQPLIKELQLKYKDDKERLNKEMLALYKQIGFNPISGCLPMVLQIPVFIILFQVLRNPEQNGFIFVNQSFYGMDLTSFAFSKLSPDFLANLHLIIPGMFDLSALGVSFFNNTYLYIPALPVVAVMCVTTVVQQKMMTVDPQQKSMMWMMNLMIVYFAFMMPTGVLLYWGVSNVLQLIQQAFTKTSPQQQAAAHKTLAGSKNASKKGNGKKSTNKPDIIIDNAKKTAVQDDDEDDWDFDEKGLTYASDEGNKPSAAATGKAKKSYPARKSAGSKKKKKRK